MTNPTDQITRSGELPRVLRTVVEIAAPPARVFEALTDPRELATWWDDDASSTSCESDPRPGGEWHVRTVDPDGGEHTVGGEYRVVDPPHRLEQTWRADDEADASIVRYDLEPIAIDGSEGTRLTVTHRETVALGRMVTLALHLEVRASPARYGRVPPSIQSRRRIAWARRVLH